MGYVSSKNIIDQNSQIVQNIFNSIKKLEKRGENIINLGFSIPYIETPEQVQLTIREALMQYKHKSPQNKGIAELRMEVCNYIDRTRGFRPKLSQILIGPGLKPMLFNLLLTLLKNKDELIITDPGPYYYSSISKILGIRTKYLPILSEDNYTIDISKLEELLSNKTRAILINTPNDPTGNVISNKDLHEISKIAEKNKLLLISDETYSQIIFTGKHTTSAIFDRALRYSIILEDISNTFSMSGLGLSYCVGPSRIIERLQKISVEIIQPVPEFIQYAGVKALSDSETILPEIINKFKKCNHVMVSGLNELSGFKCTTPAGGVFVFPDVSGTKRTGIQLAKELLQKTGVVVLPGALFGKLGMNHIRLSFATEIENINEGLIRLQEFF